MDQIDRDILRELQRDGRLSNQELAQRVGLTPSPCMRRVRQLEQDGVIQGYRAVIDPAAVGRSFEVLVSVEVRREREAVEALRTQHAGDPEGMLTGLARELAAVSCAPGFRGCPYIN
ncbi:Lrp/AsnC family transcriptional regulator, partial [Kitasatospora nipponensis]|uniref:Lrp/AsnC family transcriptional regulator n=1 Tax=Kitasatospora nipponensis TaxID=258049 RepID=UPI0031D52CA4